MTAIPLGLPDPATRPAFYDGVLPKRALAWVVDMAITTLICVLILPLTFFTGVFFFPALLLVIGFVYRWFSITAGSATWGMRLFAVELRDKDGARLDPQTALAHSALFTLSFAVFPLQLISVAMMGMTPKAQGLTDHLLGTALINKMR